VGAILVAAGALGLFALLVFGRFDLLDYAPVVVMVVCAIRGFVSAPPARRSADVDSAGGEAEALPDTRAAASRQR
jgi:hypothetical protein